MKRLLAAIGALILLLSLALCADAAIASARRALTLCGDILIPSLFPFFVASRLLACAGVGEILGRRLSPLTTRLFRVSGAGAAALIAGLTGGYPLGASLTADLVRRGDISTEEGERLLPFCNNTGPAFIMGAAGAGVFGSAAVGFELYAAHVLAAVTVGVLMRQTAPATHAASQPAKAPTPEVPGFAAAITDAVGRSVMSVLTVCGFVTAFMTLTGVLDHMGITKSIAGELSGRLGLELTLLRSLLAGAMELGGGIAAMRSLPPTAGNVALCSFLLGWGGVSVHLQTAAAVEGTDIKTSRHTVGRLMAGVIAALYILLARFAAGLFR